MNVNFSLTMSPLFSMVRRRQLWCLLLLIFFSSLNLCFASVLYTFDYGCFSDDLYPVNNSSYGTNINGLSVQISSTKELNYGFYNLTVGERPFQVNAIGLCRGDVKQDVCKSCLNEIIPALKRSCPNNTKAVGWSDLCIFRYSNRDIFGVMETEPYFYLDDDLNVSNVRDFNMVLNSLLNNLTSLAASGGNLRKYAVDNGTSSNNLDRIYTFVQCTPDLSEQECSNCLATAMGKMFRVCSGSIGCRLLQPSCMMRYETRPFFGAADDLPQPSPPPPSSPPPPLPIEGKQSNKAPTVLIIVIVASVLGVSLLLLCIWICLRLRKSREMEDSVDEIIKVETLQHDFATIQAATSNFCDENKLGRGGFGPVYKGQLANGQLIAVKRLSSGSGQGDTEFKNEVLLMAKLQHRNLVKLLGFCLKGDERLLIYEFVPNRSLDHFIFDPIKNAQLDWERRYKIIGGIARGLLYLHEDSQLRVIHCDLKASNVLLDVEMNPKISDFGMARLFVVDETHGTTRRVVGTYGYMAPEYVKHGHFSIKTDVFSFGIMVLEIMSGQKNSSSCHIEDGETLISLAWRNWKEGKPLNILDPNLRESSTAQMMRCVHIGLLCVQENVLRRPTMGSIVEMLTNNYIILPTPSHPAFFMHKRFQLDISSSRDHEYTQSTDGQALPSINQVSVSELDPR